MSLSNGQGPLPLSDEDHVLISLVSVETAYAIARDYASRIFETDEKPRLRRAFITTWRSLYAVNVVAQKPPDAANLKLLLEQELSKGKEGCPPKIESN